MRKLFLLCIIIIYGCNPYKIIKETDKFNPNITLYYSTPVNIKSSNPFDMAEISVQFVNIVKPDTSIYGMAFNYDGKKWAFIESTKFLVDGNIFEVFPATKPIRKITLGTFVTESLAIRFLPEQVKLLENAKTIDIRIQGNDRSFDVNFNIDLRNKLKEFLLLKNNMLKDF